MTLVTIAIPNYNDEGKLNLLLDSILNQNYPIDKIEVSICDDCSQDKSIEIIKSYNNKGINIRLGRNNINKGRASAANLAINQASGEIIIICDNDFELPPNFISEHLKSHTNVSKTIVIGSLENKHSISSIYTDFVDYYQNKINSDCLKNKDSLHFKFFRANASFKKCEFQNMQLFNENFKIWGYEDVEFGYRLMKSGFKFIYNPAAVAYHNLCENNFLIRCSRNYNTGQNKALFVSLYPQGKYDILSRNIDSGNVAVKLNYLVRFLFCLLILKNKIFPEEKILNFVYRFVIFWEKRKLKFPLFKLYHIVAGIYLDVGYFKSLAQRKK